MGNTGLDDVWVESGAFAQNFANAMMEGKTYYRAVRGHVMAYEALCRIKWKLFQSWAGKRSSLQDLDDEVKLLHDLFADKHNETVDVEISEQILQLLQTLKESIIINGLWIQFNKIFSENPNYSYCLTHMELVEIMLDFIRAYKIGDWKIHLQTFVKMLPWFGT